MKYSTYTEEVQKFARSGKKVPKKLISSSFFQGPFEGARYARPNTSSRTNTSSRDPQAEELLGGSVSESAMPAIQKPRKLQPLGHDGSSSRTNIVPQPHMRPNTNFQDSYPGSLASQRNFQPEPLLEEPIQGSLGKTRSGGLRPDIPLPGEVGTLKLRNKPSAHQAPAIPSKKHTQELGQFLEELVKEHGHERAKSKLQKPQTPRLPALPVERCSRCTKEEMWAVYSVFKSLDAGRKHKITRKDFFNRDNPKHPTLLELRVLQKAGLDERFRHSEKAVSLEEFLQLMWPECSENDVKVMVHWARLSDAQAVLKDPKFRGEVPELREIFDLLDEDCDGNLSMGELDRAGILSKTEIAALMRNRESAKPQCNFDEFLAVTQAHFKDVFISSETRRAMQQEKEDDSQLALRNAFASGFHKIK